MGFFSKLSENIKKMFSHNEGRTIRERGNYVLGGDISTRLNKWKTTYELLSLGDFVRCVQILSNDISKIQFETQELIDVNGKEFFTNKTISNWNYLWNVNPSNDLSPEELKKVIVWNIFLYGAAAIYIVKDKSSKPVELIPIFRNFIQRKTENGVPYYLINFGGSTESRIDNSDIQFKDDTIRVENEDIIWIPYEILDNYSNAEFRTLFSVALNKIQQNEISQMNALTNDIGVSLFIKLRDASNEEQRLMVAESLRESAKIMKETGMLAFVIDDKMEVSGNDKFVQSPVSLELRKYVASEVAAKFGLPPSFLGIETPNQSLSQLNRFYLDRGLEPLANLIVQKISYSIFKDKRKRISYNTLNLSGLDLNEKISAISQAINNGIMTQNEGRAWLGLHPVENGNELLLNAAIQSKENMEEKTQAEINKLDSEAEKNLNENVENNDKNVIM